MMALIFIGKTGPEM